jgi:bifunctional DNA-binding transcriptional regulator/antitoxin component of YhaV-PrlF toxin-antitoxin module
MFIRIITISSQGQFTIPSRIRKTLIGKKFLLEFDGEVIVLKPCHLMIKKKYSEAGLIEKILKLDPEQKLLYSIILHEPCTTDNLCEKTGFSISKVNVLLTGLEFEGVIRRNSHFLWEAV